MRNMEKNRSVVSLSPEARKRVERAMKSRGESASTYYTTKGVEEVGAGVSERVAAMSGKERKADYKSLYFNHAASGAGLDGGKARKEFSFTRAAAGLSAADQNIAITLAMYMTPEDREAARHEVYNETMTKFDRGLQALDKRARRVSEAYVRDGETVRGLKDRREGAVVADARSEEEHYARLRSARSGAESRRWGTFSIEEEGGGNEAYDGATELLKARHQDIDRRLAEDNAARLRAIESIPPGKPESYFDTSPWAMGQLDALYRDRRMSGKPISMYDRFKLLITGVPPERE